MQPKPGANGTAIHPIHPAGVGGGAGLRPAVFVLFAYLPTLSLSGGSLSILAAIQWNPNSTPHVLLPGNLSVLDIGCITVTVPSMLGRLLSLAHSSPMRPASHSFLLPPPGWGGLRPVVLAMAYDRFLAICQTAHLQHPHEPRQSRECWWLCPGLVPSANA